MIPCTPATFSIKEPMHRCDGCGDFLTEDDLIDYRRYESVPWMWLCKICDYHEFFKGSPHWRRMR